LPPNPADAGRPAKRTNHRGMVVSSYSVGRQLSATGRHFLYEGRSLGGSRKVTIKIMTEPHDAYRRGRGLVVNPYIHELRAALEVGANLVVRHLDVGTTPAGEHYLVRERADGELASEALARQGPLSLPDAVAVAADAALAVERLHKLGLVRVNLSPSNIIVHRDEETGTWRGWIADLDGFEIVGTRSALLPDELIAAPLYLAPEMISGAPLRPAVDIYSLGSLLYTLIAGKPPLDLPDAPASAVADYLRGNGRIPSEKLRFLVRGLPDEADMLISKCLKRGAADRPGSVEQFVRGLHHLLTVHRDQHRDQPIHKSIWNRVARDG